MVAARNRVYGALCDSPMLALGPPKMMTDFGSLLPDGGRIVGVSVAFESCRSTQLRMTPRPEVDNCGCALPVAAGVVTGCTVGDQEEDWPETCAATVNATAQARNATLLRMGIPRNHILAPVTSHVHSTPPSRHFHCTVSPQR